jgi:hypothetical protein
MKMSRKEEDYQQGFTDFGEWWELSEEVNQKLYALVCSISRFKTNDFANKRMPVHSFICTIVIIIVIMLSAAMRQRLVPSLDYCSPFISLV